MTRDPALRAWADPRVWGSAGPYRQDLALPIHPDPDEDRRRIREQVHRNYIAARQTMEDFQ